MCNRLRFVPLLCIPIIAACSHVQVIEKSIQEADGFFVEYEEYRSKKSSENNTEGKRGVVILPATGGSNFLDRQYAKSLSSRGAIVKIITSYSGDDERSYDLQVHERIHRKALRALDAVLKTYDSSQKVSLFGTSLGGLYASLATISTPLFERVLVIGAGVPIPDIIVESDLDSMQELRDIRFKLFGFESDDEYIRALRENYSIDPLLSEQKIASIPQAMVILRKDKTVPADSQYRLRKLWGPEWELELDRGHFWGIISVWLFHSDKVEDFLLGF